MEVQIKKEKTTTRAGQYIFISCPEVSYFQWHPFTLTSAPEEEFLSVHIRVAGDFTTAFAKALGCDFPERGPKKDAGGDKDKKVPPAGVVVATRQSGPFNKNLPRIMVDGPFGSASEDFLKYETILLVGAGIGVTPFASCVLPLFDCWVISEIKSSILKSIWYRMNNFNNSKPTRLSKVYFTWVIGEFGAAEWFHSVLQAIEEEDFQNRIEINIYYTKAVKEDDMNNIIVRLLLCLASKYFLMHTLIGPRRRCRERRHHFPPRPDTFRAPQLGPSVLFHRREAPRDGRGRVLLRSTCVEQDSAQDEQQVL